MIIDLGGRMIKYILIVVIAITIGLVSITIGANNDQVIMFNYMIAQNEFKLSTLVALLFGFGLILGWLISAMFCLKLKLKNMALMRQVKRQTQQIAELSSSRDKAVQ